MIPDGAQLLAFVVVAFASQIVPVVAIWSVVNRGFEKARVERERDRRRELDLLAKMVPPRRKTVRGFLGREQEREDDPPVGWAVTVVYAPAPSDDAAATLRERA